MTLPCRNGAFAFADTWQDRNAPFVPVAAGAALADRRGRFCPVTARTAIADSAEVCALRRPALKRVL
jgi:hypothetical protein